MNIGNGQEAPCSIKEKIRKGFFYLRYSTNYSYNLDNMNCQFQPHYNPPKRDLEAQLDETLASLRMEKALVCGELSEEESMLQLERNQLSDISTPDQHARNDELIMELQKTIQDRSGRIDALKVSELIYLIVE